MRWSRAISSEGQTKVRQFEAVYDFAIAEDGWDVEIRGLFADEYAHWISPDVGVTIEVKGPAPSLP